MCGLGDPGTIADMVCLLIFYSNEHTRGLSRNSHGKMFESLLAFKCVLLDFIIGVLCAKLVEFLIS